MMPKMGMKSSMAKRNQGLGLALTLEAGLHNLFGHYIKVAHSVPQAKHEDGGDEGGDEQAPCHQQVDLPGRKPFKNPKHLLRQKISPDELAPHRCQVKGVTKSGSTLHLAGLAVVEGAVRVSLLLLTTGAREIIVAASSIPHLLMIGSDIKKYYVEIQILLLPALLPWRLLSLPACKFHFPGAFNEGHASSAACIELMRYLCAA